MWIKAQDGELIAPDKIYPSNETAIRCMHGSDDGGCTLIYDGPNRDRVFDALCAALAAGAAYVDMATLRAVEATDDSGPYIVRLQKSFSDGPEILRVYDRFGDVPAALSSLVGCFGIDGKERHDDMTFETFVAECLTRYGITVGEEYRPSWAKRDDAMNRPIDKDKALLGDTKKIMREAFSAGVNSADSDWFDAWFDEWMVS